jgi:hypothetical protein
MKHTRLFLFKAVLAGAVAWAAAAPAGAANPAFVGAARIFGLDEVTVVYPAGEGQDAELNRISAERRAAYLERHWDIETSVTADDALSEEQLAGNLLLLGWSNRLIGTSRAPHPYANTEAGRMFLGSIPVLADEDLLFGAVSPYDPDSWLFFWSRIDPERDRFLVIPVNGSDWAVYRDYRVMDQGMFVDPENWPPTRDRGAEMSHRGTKPLPMQDRSAHFALHGTLPEEEVPRILAAREKSFAKVTSKLGAPAEGFIIGLYVYRSDEDKERRTGVPAGAHSIPGSREIHMTQRVAQSGSLREEANVVAAALFGPAKITAFHDGLATLLELPPSTGGLPLYAAMLLDQGRMPQIESLLDEEAMRKLLHSRVGLTASGLLVGWLREVGGRELLARAYSSFQLDTADLAGWLGLSPAEAEASFQEWVGSLADTAQTELAFRKAEEQAREQRMMGDREAEAEALARALTHKPDHPATLYALALALVESGQDEQAESRLLRLVGLSVGPEDSRYVVFGYYQLGRAYENMGRLEKAEKAYESMLQMPDEHGAHRMAREALEVLRGSTGETEESPVD